MINRGKQKKTGEIPAYTTRSCTMHLILHCDKLPGSFVLFCACAELGLCLQERQSRPRVFEDLGPTGWLGLKFQEFKDFLP
jgi:hypothetical protein